MGNDRTDDLFGGGEGSEVDGVDRRLLLSQSMCAALIGISVQAFQKWNIEPHSKRGREVLYDWRKVLAARDRRYFPEPDPDAENRLDLDQQRARLAAVQAERIEIELAEQRKTICYTWQIADNFGMLVSNFRSHVLALPSRLGSLFGPKVAATAEEVLYQALDALQADNEFDEFRPFDEGERVIFDAVTRRWSLNKKVVDVCGACGLPIEAPENSGPKKRKRKRKV